MGTALKSGSPFMKYIQIIVACIGAGSIGSNFSKELARFMSYYNTRNEYVDLLLIDDGVVNREDLDSHPFLLSDIGFNKAGVVIGAIRDSYREMEKRNAKGYALHIETGKQIRDIISACEPMYAGGEKTAKMIYLIDTVGSMETKKAAKEFFNKEKNIVMLSVSSNVSEGEIEVGVRANGFSICNGIQKAKNSIGIPSAQKHVSALICSHLLLSMVCNGVVNKQIDIVNVPYNTMQYSSKMDCIKNINDEGREEDLPEHAVVVCVGAGGTGGNFSKEFARFMMYHEGIPSISFVLIDGDRVESKNRQRQPFANEDLMQNKAFSLIQAMKECYMINENSVKAYPYYIDTVEQLEEAISLGYQNGKKNKVYLLGCVDNHRARQVMEEYFNASTDLIYVDSANEFSNGEVVIGAKENGNVISPSRAYYFPDVLTDMSPTASELSCGVVNVSSPQHLVTNLAASHLLLAFIVKSIAYRKTDKGIIYFDAFTYFSRYQQFKKEVAVL